jgi:hypothetical protein
MGGAEEQNGAQILSSDVAKLYRARHAAWKGPSPWVAGMSDVSTHVHTARASPQRVP